MSFVAELEHRNVVRAALFQIVSAGLLVQVAETVLPLFEVPDNVFRGLVILLAVGLVPALVFAWVFEWTPDGIRLDGVARQPGSIERLERTGLRRELPPGHRIDPARRAVEAAVIEAAPRPCARTLNL